MPDTTACQFCGRIFTRGCARAVHERTCKSNPAPRPLVNHVSGFKIAAQRNACNNRRPEPWPCSWCGKEFPTRASRQEHARNEHPDLIHSAWNKGLKASTDVRVAQYAATLAKRYANGDIIAWNIGTHHDDATKAKIRESTIQYVRSVGPCTGPRYSTKACEYFNLLNERNGWHLQHALNGGEIRVGRYSLDAYDAELNIVVEYDEHRHHYMHGSRVTSDVERMRAIMSSLGCTVYIYDEHTDVLRQINKPEDLLTEDGMGSDS